MSTADEVIENAPVGLKLFATFFANHYPKAVQLFELGVVAKEDIRAVLGLENLPVCKFCERAIEGLENLYNSAPDLSVPDKTEMQFSHYSRKAA